MGDGVYSQFAASNYMGPVMHHGIKNPDVVKKTYYKSISRCELNNQGVLKDFDRYSNIVLGLARGYPNFFPQGHSCKQCVERCMWNLSCPPLEHGERAPQLETAMSKSGERAPRPETAVSKPSSGGRPSSNKS